MYGQNNYGMPPLYTGAPYYGSSPVYQTPHIQQQSQQGMLSSTNTNKLYTTGIDDVRARQLPPNSDFIFLDNDKPLIYRKTTDATGKMDIQTFEIKPYVAEQTVSVPSVDMSQFALKSDIEFLKAQVEDMRENLSKKSNRKNSGGEE